MPNDLDQVAAAAPKNVEITSVRITLQALLNETRQAREAAAHIGVAGRKPHPHITRYGNHRRSSTSRTRASASGSTCASTRMRRRLPSSISINPIRAATTDRPRLSPAGKSFGVSSASVAAICTGAKELHVDQIVVGVSKECRPLLAPGPLRRGVDGETNIAQPRWRRPCRVVEGPDRERCLRLASWLHHNGAATRARKPPAIF